MGIGGIKVRTKSYGYVMRVADFKNQVTIVQAIYLWRERIHHVTNSL